MGRYAPSIKVVSMEEVCKHNQTGYCKHGHQCSREHVNVMCPNFNNCSVNTCALRHPKTCKHFSMYQDCKFKNCAYSHDQSKCMTNIGKLEVEVGELKSAIHENKETNKKLDHKIRNINEQLSNTFSIVLKQLMDLEKENIYKKEAALNDTRLETDNIILKSMVQLDTTKTKKKLVQEANTKKHKYQCNQCNFKGKN